MMVVITLMVMLLLTGASLFFTTLIGTGKTNSGFQIKEEGDFVIGQLEFLIRNAIDLEPAVQSDTSVVTCQPGMDTLAIKNFDNGVSTFTLVDDNGHNKIASISSVTAENYFLTTDRVEVTAGPTFNCSRNSDGTGAFIEVAFTLRKGTPGLDQPRDIVTQDFSAGVAVRGVQ